MFSSLDLDWICNSKGNAGLWSHHRTLRCVYSGSCTWRLRTCWVEVAWYSNGILNNIELFFTQNNHNLDQCRFSRFSSGPLVTHHYKTWLAVQTCSNSNHQITSLKVAQTEQQTVNYGKFTSRLVNFWSTSNKTAPPQGGNFAAIVDTCWYGSTQINIGCTFPSRHHTENSWQGRKHRGVCDRFYLQSLHRKDCSKTQSVKYSEISWYKTFKNATNRIPWVQVQPFSYFAIFFMLTKITASCSLCCSASLARLGARPRSEAVRVDPRFEMLSQWREDACSLGGRYLVAQLPTDENCWKIASLSI